MEDCGRVNFNKKRARIQQMDPGFKTYSGTENKSRSISEQALPKSRCPARFANARSQPSWSREQRCQLHFFAFLFSTICFTLKEGFGFKSFVFMMIKHVCLQRFQKFRVYAADAQTFTCIRKKLGKSTIIACQTSVAKLCLHNFMVVIQLEQAIENIADGILVVHQDAECRRVFRKQKFLALLIPDNVFFCRLFGDT